MKSHRLRHPCRFMLASGQWTLMNHYRNEESRILREMLETVRVLQRNYGGRPGCVQQVKRLLRRAGIPIPTPRHCSSGRPEHEQAPEKRLPEEGSRAPRVVVDPQVMGGTPCLAGSRLPVQTLLDMVDAGDAWEQIVGGWPWLTPQHVKVAREWLANGADGRAGDAGRGSAFKPPA